ncbi:hypothetical protein [Acinetobacter ihumii]|uniref:hypothetical protein n=1 Tax=Acinetobacter ihumii TaxID=2483802 RepID=UPI001D180EF3|nr:hypothetical protein [Acinetobacter ihumii]
MKSSRFISQVTWTVEMDSILIEHVMLDISELVLILDVEETEILERKKVLGLLRRARQLRKTM